MTVYVVASTDVGAPVLSGVNGAGKDVIKYAAVTIAGMTNLFETTNAITIRANYGNQFCLNVQHDSAVSGDARRMTVRGAEGASGTTSASLVDPFPTVAQSADSGGACWLVSNSATSAARPWVVVVDDGATSGYPKIEFYSNYSASTNVWDKEVWADFYPTFSGDTYNTLVSTSAAQTGTSAAGFASGQACSSLFVQPTNGVYIARNLGGSVKSVWGGLIVPGAGVFGDVNASLAQWGTGYGSKYWYDYVGVSDSGSNSTGGTSSSTIPVRGFMHGQMVPITSDLTTVNSLDEIADTNFDAGAEFLIIRATNNSTGGGVMTQIAGDWTPPY